MIAAGCFCLLACLLLAPLSPCVSIPVPTPPLTVLMDFDSPHSEAPLQSLRRNLNHLLTPGGISVDLQLKENLPANPQFGQLVIFKMRGACSMNSAPNRPAARQGPLAMAYTSDGQVLHFGEVECDRVRYALQRVLGRGGSRKNQDTYGAALAVVIAHEVYHMLGNATHHTRKGVTKPALSADELTSPNLALSPEALAAMLTAQ